MAQPNQTYDAWRRAFLAGLMVLLLWLLGLAAANQRFHAQLHLDDSAQHGLCSICALAHGQLDSPGLSSEMARCSPVLVPFLAPIADVVQLPVDLSVAMSRGPPVSVSPL